MSITPLSASTVRILGSSQTLTSPTSLVKELVDNALDANATSVFVEISYNSLDIIQVKDNGYGIAPEDREVVGKRHHTSKIRDFDDIRSVGGASLGFRGEALASAIDLSNGLTLTTRTETENVGTRVSFRSSGDNTKENASHPIGTSVRAAGMLRGLPVRREAALKSASKTLCNVKTLLQAFALARPTVRFSLKVLKAKNSKSDWSYAPSPSSANQMENAVRTIFGRDFAVECSKASYQEATEGAEPSEGLFQVESYLPKSDADMSKINSKGQYVSVDGRPISCVRGFFKQVLSLYKSALRASSSQYGVTLKAPFICLNVQCPSQSYDPNIEPAKDDVLFEDESRVLSFFESFFTHVYGDFANVSRADNTRKKTSTPVMEKGFELLLARKLPQQDQMIQSPEEQLSKRQNRSRSSSIESRIESEPGKSDDERLEGHQERPPTQARWSTNMYDMDGESDDGLLGKSRLDETVPRGLEDSNGQDDLEIIPAERVISGIAMANRRPKEDRPRTHLPSPSATSVQTSPPRQRSSPTHSSRRQQIGGARDFPGQGSLDEWFDRGQASPPRESSPSDGDDHFHDATSPLQKKDRTPGFISAHQTLLNGGAHRELGGASKPFRSPMKDNQPRDDFSGPIEDNVPGFQASGQSSFSHPDIEPLLEFERRKLLASRQRRQMQVTEQLTSTQQSSESGRLPAHPSSQKSPHRSRYEAAVASLGGSKKSPSSVVPIEYFQGEEAAQTKSKEHSRKAKKAMKTLPLESTPSDLQLHKVILPLRAELKEIQAQAHSLLSVDNFLLTSDDERGSVLDLNHEQLRGSLQTLLRSAYRDETGESVDIPLKLAQ